jgi:hypothetical protein
MFGQASCRSTLRSLAPQLTFVAQVITSLKSDNPATVAIAGNIRRYFSLNFCSRHCAFTTNAMISSPRAICAIYFSISYSTTQQSKYIEQCIGQQHQMHSSLSPFPCPILSVLSASM